MPRSLVKVYRSFGGTICLHPQDRRVILARNHHGVDSKYSNFYWTTLRHIAEYKTKENRFDVYCETQYKMISHFRIIILSVCYSFIKFYC
jgi:hypothetical protein